MTTRHQSTGLCVIIQDPVTFANRTSYGRFAEQIQSLSFSTRSIGGYWDAKIKINYPLNEIEGWIESGGATGLGRHIVIYNPSLDVIWEGFVNGISAVLGGVTYKLGSLKDITNRDVVTFNTTDVVAVPPISGIKATTDTANDLDSQALYGIIQKIIPKGATTLALAEQGRDAWLEDKKDPQVNTNDNVTGNAGPNLQLSCLGYWHWFDMYTYSDLTARNAFVFGTHTGANNVAILTDGTASFITDGVSPGMFIENTTDVSSAKILAVTATTITGILAGGTDNDWDTGDAYEVIGSQVNLSDYIQTIASAQLNSIISTDFLQIESNTLQVPSYQDKNAKASSLLKTLNSFGDASNNQYSIGVYQNRQLVYKQIPSFFEYQRRITSNSNILGRLQNPIDPWDILPGRWILYSDFLSGRFPPVTAASLSTDPRATFIQTMKFQAPNRVSISGERLGESDQVFAKFGVIGQGT